MSSVEFKRLCVDNSFRPPYVLQDAKEEGYTYSHGFYVSLDTLVEMEAAKYHNQIN